MREHFDLLVRGGLLVDGSGAPAVRGDVGIRGGRIAATGDVRGEATRVLDADGAVVAPGFVDIHTHYDAQVFWDRMLTISPWHGVTITEPPDCYRDHIEPAFRDRAPHIDVAELYRIDLAALE